MLDQSAHPWSIDCAAGQFEPSGTEACTGNDGRVGSGHAAALLDQLPSQMLGAVASSQAKDTMLTGLIETITPHVTLAAVVYFERDADGRLRATPRHLAGDADFARQHAVFLHGISDRACQRGVIQIDSGNPGVGVTIAVPVISQGQPPEAFCTVLRSDTLHPPERVAEMLQFAAAHVTLWYVLQTSLNAEKEVKNSSALLDVMARMKACDNLERACQTLANDLQEFLGCHSIAAGMRRGVRGNCRLIAISGHARFDEHAGFAEAIETALDEAILQNRVIVYPPRGGEERQGSSVFQRLRDVLGASQLICAPLLDERSRAVGAWLFVDPPDDPGASPIVNFVRASQQQIGICLTLVRRGRRGPLRRLVRALGERSKWPKTMSVLAGVAGLAVLLAWPFPHNIRCDCKVQPVLRRFVVAPHDGILQKTLVEPGEEVAQGQVLAQMDGREIRLELSSLAAEYQRARKAWEAALSTEDIAEAQQANLEMKRLKLKTELLEQRQQHLQIKSPIRGIVVSGDLENSQGAPLTTGQNLFEIAPIKQMTVEIEIPEEDISYVTEQMDVHIRLDAFPRKSLPATIRRIVPRAQQREDQMVFLAKTRLDNVTETLRPGMSGRAKLVAPRRPLAWILFHKPYETLLMIFGW